MTVKAEKAWKAIGFILASIIIPTIAILVALGVIHGPTKDTEQPLAVGDIMRFGQYDWRVLDIDTVYNRALLLSQDIIEQRPYNTEWADVTWENCSLRNYLNSSFYGSFNEGDRSRIALTRNTNPDNTWGTWKGERFNTPGGNQTEDHIFLLSVPEILKYFPGLRLCKDSDRDKWLYEADERLVAKFNNNESWWWLRSPGYLQNSAAIVYNDGDVLLFGDGVSDETGGVRPALWLNL